MTDELRGTRVGRTRTNTEILQPHEMLHDLEKQRAYVLKAMVLPKRGCPVCGTAVNYLEAAGIELDEFDSTGDEKPALTCPNCKASLRDDLLIGGQYVWGVNR